MDSYRSKSKDALAQIKRDAKKIQAKMPIIEDWISSNAGFYYEATSTEIQESTAMNANEATDEGDASSKEDQEISEERHSLMALPRVSEMENFMTEGSAFQNLFINIEVFLLASGFATACPESSNNRVTCYPDCQYTSERKIYSYCLGSKEHDGLWNWPR